MKSRSFNYKKWIIFEDLIGKLLTNSLLLSLWAIHQNLHLTEIHKNKTFPIIYISNSQ